MRSSTRTVLRLGARVLLVLAVSALSLEGLLRWALFGEGELAGRVARRLGLRRAELYAAPWSSDYWRLRHRLGQTSAGWIANPDPLLGWLPAEVEAGSYAHSGEGEVGERRAVLLFGDSYARCATAAADCWEGLLERSPLGERYRLLNYGAGGYGLDQTVLLCRSVLPRFAARSPVVVVSLLVDDDLDRSLLEVRSWPKPRYRLVGGSLVRGERALPASREEFWADMGLSIPSYAWRRLVHGTSLLPWRLREGDTAARARELRELNQALLRELAAELDAAGLTWFVLLFHGWSWLGEPNAAVREREAIVLDELRALGAPWVSAREILVEDARATGRGRADYWQTDGPSPNHYTPLGNEIVFRALHAGLEGRFER